MKRTFVVQRSFSFTTIVGTVLFAPFHLHLFTFFLLHPLITSLPYSIMYISDYPLCVCFYPLPLCPAQPFIRGPPVDLTVNQSSQATFSCTAQGNPVPTISWTGPSANFTTEVAPGVNFTVLSVLTIDSAVRAVHEGPYTCHASNGVGPYPSSSAALTVQGTAGDPPPHNTRCTVTGHTSHLHQLHLRSHPPADHITHCRAAVMCCSFHSQLHYISHLSSPSPLLLFLSCVPPPSPPPPPPLPSVPPTVQAVQGRIVGIPERSITLSFTILDASPEVQTENIQWTFRDLNGSNSSIPTNFLTTTFSNLMGVFSSDRLSLTLSDLINDFEGTYTMTATNEAGSDFATVELVIEGQCFHHLVICL